MTKPFDGVGKSKFVNGKKYILQVALVHTYKPDGTPKLIGLIGEKDIVNLAGGEHFITCYIPENVTLNGKA